MTKLLVGGIPTLVVNYYSLRLRCLFLCTYCLKLFYLYLPGLSIRRLPLISAPAPQTEPSGHTTSTTPHGSSVYRGFARLCLHISEILSIYPRYPTPIPYWVYLLIRLILDFCDISSKFYLRISSCASCLHNDPLLIPPMTIYKLVNSIQ